MDVPRHLGCHNDYNNSKEHWLLAAEGCKSGVFVGSENPKNMGSGKSMPLVEDLLLPLFPIHVSIKEKLTRIS